MNIPNRLLVRPAVCVALAVTGCSPRHNGTLDRAALDVRSAQQDPQLAANAPELLNDAVATYNMAEREWSRSGNREEVDHMVYLTERKLEAAREDARRRVALDQAGDERARARIAAGDLRADEIDARARLRESHALIAENQALVDQMSRQVARLRAEETRAGLEINLGSDVLFGSDRSALKPGALLRLRPVIDFLRTHPDRDVRIEGHTDGIGSESYNTALSQRRADAVRNLLVGEGIAPERITARGMGESFPVATNASEAGRLQNRRVAILISPAQSNPR